MSFSTRIGGLTLAGRPDLALGRPRSDGTQTMFLCDFKTGALRDEHLWNSLLCVGCHTAKRCCSVPVDCFSLSSGQWTDPTVTYDILIETAHDVATAIAQQIEVVSGSRDPLLTPGKYCQWCPLQIRALRAAWQHRGQQLILNGLKSVRVSLLQARLLPQLSTKSRPGGETLTKSTRSKSRKGLCVKQLARSRLLRAACSCHEVFRTP